jgi:GNAT superfamily N-acetyltransferase
MDTPPALRLLFEQIGPQRQFSLSELQERADHNVWSKDRRQYRVWLGEQDVAFLTFDIFWEDQLNLYEVFVASGYRRCGVGAAIIRFAADLARRMGKPRLTIRARPLSGQSQKDLIAWYIRQGLTPTPGEPEFLVMDITQP